MSLTRKQTHAALTSAGWPSDLLDVMTAIAAAESSLRVDVVGGPNSDGTYDYGLLQINSRYVTGGPKWSKDRLLSDPVYNCACAKTLYDSQGLKAWAAFTAGRYLPYMPPNAGGPTLGPSSGARFLIQDLQLFLNGAVPLTGDAMLSGTGAWGTKTAAAWAKYQAAHLIEPKVCGPVYWKRVGL